MSVIKKIQDLRIFKGRFTYLCLFKDRMMFRHLPSDSRLLNLKSLYKGRRCFIVALGPSLKLSDLNELVENNEITFSMNRCYEMFDKTTWRPDYYFLSDKKAFTPKVKAEIEKMIAGKTTVVYSKFAVPKGMPDEAIYYKANYTDAILSSSRKNKYRKKAKPLRCSTDAYEFIYDGHTCVHSIIQLAYYMGFKEVYLLGVDCGVIKNKSYSELLGEPSRNIENMNRLGDLYIEDYASLKNDIERKKLDIAIYNATKGGRLEVFPRVDFSKLF